MNQNAKKIAGIDHPVETPVEPKTRYADPAVQNYDVANYVRIQTSRFGMVLEFGKLIPGENEILITRDILLPFDVASALKTILIKQFDELKEKGLVEEIGIEKGDDKQ